MKAVLLFYYIFEAHILCFALWELLHFFFKITFIYHEKIKLKLCFSAICSTSDVLTYLIVSNNQNILNWINIHVIIVENRLIN